MPLENRVDPWGRSNAVTARGELMGNRGILHDEHQKIVSQWKHRRWVTCKREFQDIKRKPFSLGNYSELFFLDEATAFAAGHRPCSDCRKDRFKEFKSAWVASNPELLSKPRPSIEEIDKIIHSERAAKGGGKITFEAPINDLPRGTFIDVDGVALLVWRGALLPWSFDGYGPARDVLPPKTFVRVLTPASVVRVFASGFTPKVHLSAIA